MPPPLAIPLEDTNLVIELPNVINYYNDENVNELWMHVFSDAFGGSGNPQYGDGRIGLHAFVALLELLHVSNIANNLTTNGAGFVLDARQGKALYDMLADKLDASAYNDRYKGVYTTLGGLQTAHPTASLGDYAQIDTGAENAAQLAIWDAQDGWVIVGTVGISNTDLLVEGSTNKFFTNQRALDAVQPTLLYSRSDISAPMYVIDPTDFTFGGVGYKVFLSGSAQTCRLISDSLTGVTPGKAVTIIWDGTAPITLDAISPITLIGNPVFTGANEAKILVVEPGNNVRIFGAPAA